MDTRRTPQEYLNEAIQCVKEGDTQKLRKLIHSHWDAVAPQNDTPVFNDEEGKILLLTALEHQQSQMVGFLLQLNYRDFMLRPIPTITMTQALLNQALNILSLVKLGINKKNIFTIEETQLDCLNLNRISYVNRIEYETILEHLFIHFFNKQNIKNKPLMIKFFDNLRKYFQNPAQPLEPVQSPAFSAILSHCLEIICDPFAREEHLDLFAHLLSTIPETSQCIADNSELRVTLDGQTSKFNIHCQPLTPDQTQAYAVEFDTANSDLFSGIKSIGKSLESASFTFYKSNQIQSMLQLEKETFMIMAENINPAERFVNLIKRLLQERNNIINRIENSEFFPEPSNITDAIDTLLKDTLSKSKANHGSLHLLIQIRDPKNLIVDEDLFYILNVSLNRLAKEPSPENPAFTRN